MDPNWLQEEITDIAAFERAQSLRRAPFFLRDHPEYQGRTPEELVDASLVPPFLALQPQWEELKALLKEGGTLYSFCSPEESWVHLAGRAGYSVVKNEVILKSLVTEMN
jgi:hypothetical protein